MGTPTGFRQSGLRMDLDLDNSSLHPTDGYHDTLSSCSDFIPICGDDIGITTCGQTIDSISYKLHRYEIEPIDSETIFIEDGIKRSPSRWVWKNPHGNNIDKIKEHLRSVKYVISDEQDFNREVRYVRIVVTTLHAGNDSTSSWSVIILKDDSFYAGPDTTINYCPETSSFNLRDYIGDNAPQDGHFQPVLKGEEGIFQPGIDPDGPYLYITGNEECADTTIMYCPGGPEIDLGTYLQSSSPGNGSIYPPLQLGGLHFTPGVDPSGDYLYVVHASGCTDTANITLEPSETQELPFDPVYRCTDEDITISLPKGEYDNIMWWNGDMGDTAVLTNHDIGPYYVEALKDGCSYRKEFTVIEQDIGDFAGTFPDSISICPGDMKKITVMDFDSVILNGQIYTSGDQINFSDSGRYILLGFEKGCSVEKYIYVNSTIDPSSLYNQTVFWCEDSPFYISLPKDSANLLFTWSDGTITRGREVTTTGNYHIAIK